MNLALKRHLRLGKRHSDLGHFRFAIWRILTALCLHRAGILLPQALPRKQLRDPLPGAFGSTTPTPARALPRYVPNS